MKGKFFLDTNIFVYSFDARNEAKQLQAIKLIGTAMSTQMGCVSYQVVQEFLNVAHKKFAQVMWLNDCKRYLSRVFTPLCVVFSSISLYEKAQELSQRWQYSFYDSLIIASALSSGCKVLLYRRFA